MAGRQRRPREPLTPREQEVLKLIAEAHTNREIGEILHLAEKTVESHRGNLLRKLGMRDRVELVRYAIRRGLIEPLARRALLVRAARAAVRGQGTEGGRAHRAAGPLSLPLRFVCGFPDTNRSRSPPP